MDASTVADELAIRTTLSAYCQLCDDGRFDALAGLFAPGGSFTYAGEVVTGRAALAAWFAAAQPPHRRGKHLTMNAIVEIDGARATASSDFLFLRCLGGGPVPQVTGRYRDDFVREGGRWLIERRVVEEMRAPG